MLVRLVLFSSSLSSSSKITTEAELGLLPRKEDLLEFEGGFYQVTHIVLAVGKPPTIVGIPTDNPFE